MTNLTGIAGTGPLAVAWPYEVLIKYGLDFSHEIKVCENFIKRQVEQAPEAELLSRLAGGGKRIRALMVFLSCAAVFGDTESAASAAASIELLHIASLIHDDIVDRSSLRRGFATLHTLVGEAVALTIGDFLLLGAVNALFSGKTSNGPSDCHELLSVQTVILHRAQQCCRGQASELRASANVDLSTCLSIMRNKTGGLFAASCETGAIFGHPNSEITSAAAAYGFAFGLAFQMYDDLLDVLGGGLDADKSLGETFALGRPLLPVVLLSRRGKIELGEIMGRAHQSVEILELLYKDGVVGVIEEQLDLVIQDAVSALKCFPESAARYALRDYALHAYACCDVLLNARGSVLSGTR